MKRKRVKFERDVDRKLSNVDFGVHFYILIYAYNLSVFSFSLHWILVRLQNMCTKNTLSFHPVPRIMNYGQHRFRNSVSCFTVGSVPLTEFIS